MEKEREKINRRMLVKIEAEEGYINKLRLDKREFMFPSVFGKRNSILPNK